MSEINPAQPPLHGETQAYERRWIAMLVLLIASFMNMMDVTIVNVALPSLQKSLGASESAIEWVVAGYILAFALGLLPFGRYGDIIGKKRIFLIGVTAFTIASALCGMSVNIEMLIISRVIQGIGGAIMTPQVLALAQVMFPPKERAVAFSLFGLTAGLASVVGPVTGGFLIDADIMGLGWRPIFLINLPIGVIAVLAARAIVPNGRGNPELRNDWMGIILAAVAIFCLIFPLIEGRGFGWPLWCFAMMAAFLPLGAAFVLWERRQAATGQPQLFPATLMGNGNYMFGSLTSMVFFSAMPGYFLVLAVFFQSGYGLDPLHSGLTTIPFPIGVLIASVITGRLAGKAPRIRMVAGVALLVCSIAILHYVVADMGDALLSTSFILPMFLGGLGTGITISPLFQLALASVPPRDAGSGSGALQAIQQMGGALGVAIISYIFFSAVAKGMASGVGQHEAFKSALLMGLWYNVACYLVVAAAAILLLKAPPQQTPHPHGARPAAPQVMD